MISIPIRTPNPPVEGGDMGEPSWWAGVEPASNAETIAYMLTIQGSGYWYIASPYTKYPNGRQAAADDATMAGAWLVRRGVHVFVPITHSHPISQFLPRELDTLQTWMDQDHPLMACAVGLCVVKMPTWDESTGIAEEIKTFEQAGKPVVKLAWPLDRNK